MQEIKIYESEFASQLPAMVGRDYPELQEGWSDMRQIGFRDEPAQYSVVDTLRNALDDAGAEVYALGAYYIGITNHAFRKSESPHFYKAAITKSHCVVA
jgi:hypothetical protein